MEIGNVGKSYLFIFLLKLFNILLLTCKSCEFYSFIYSSQKEIRQILARFSSSKNFTGNNVAHVLGSEQVETGWPIPKSRIRENGKMVKTYNYNNLLSAFSMSSAYYLSFHLIIH